MLKTLVPNITGPPSQLELKLPTMSISLMRELKSLKSREEMCVGTEHAPLLSALSHRYNLPDASGVVSSSHQNKSVVGLSLIHI